VAHRTGRPGHPFLVGELGEIDRRPAGEPVTSRDGQVGDVLEQLDLVKTLRHFQWRIEPFLDYRNVDIASRCQRNADVWLHFSERHPQVAVLIPQYFQHIRQKPSRRG